MIRITINPPIKLKEYTINDIKLWIKIFRETGSFFLLIRELERLGRFIPNFFEFRNGIITYFKNSGKADFSFTKYYLTIRESLLRRECIDLINNTNIIIMNELEKELGKNSFMILSTLYFGFTDLLNQRILADNNRGLNIYKKK